MMNPTKSDLDLVAPEEEPQEEMFPPEAVEQVANMIRRKLAQDFMRSITTKQEPETPEMQA